MAQLKGSGLQDRRKVILAAALGVAVLALAIHTLFGGSGAPPPAPPPPAFATAPRHALRSASAGDNDQAAANAPITSLDPTLHPELMAGTENYVYTGSGRNIFSADSGPSAAETAAIEKVRGKIRPEPIAPTAPAAPPGPPAIDLRFFGYSAHRDGVRRAFLKQGDTIFVAGEGDVVGHRYKVVHIAPFSIQIEDLPYNDTQTLPLIQN